MDSQTIEDFAYVASCVCDICRNSSIDDYLINYSYCNACVARDNLVVDGVHHFTPMRFYCYGCNNMMRMTSLFNVKICLNCDCQES